MIVDYMNKLFHLKDSNSSLFLCNNLEPSKFAQKLIYGNVIHDKGVESLEYETI